MFIREVVLWKALCLPLCAWLWWPKPHSHSGGAAAQVKTDWCFPEAIKRKANPLPNPSYGKSMKKPVIRWKIPSYAGTCSFKWKVKPDMSSCFIRPIGLTAFCVLRKRTAFWLARKDIPHSDLAHDMAAMMELFDDDSKSESYYLPDRADGEYRIFCKGGGAPMEILRRELIYLWYHFSVQFEQIFGCI